jgi:hypothetical protein
VCVIYVYIFFPFTKLLYQHGLLHAICAFSIQKKGLVGAVLRMRTNPLRKSNGDNKRAKLMGRPHEPMLMGRPYEPRWLKPTKQTPTNHTNKQMTHNF